MCARSITGGRPLSSRILFSATKSCKDYVPKRGIKSLALTCYFHQPDLGMTEYEYLSRGTASLLAVDPPPVCGEGPYGHLEAAEVQRKMRDFKKKHGYSPAMGAGNVSDMGWLEFVPREHRPNVHVVTSSHVVSPFLWLDYYPHDWLTQVGQEHCKYTLEVFDTMKPGEVLGCYDLHNSPIHHPEGRDIAFLHLQEEDTVLKEMKKFGVEPLSIRDPDKLFSKEETIYFDGFLVHDPQGEASENANSCVFEPFEEIGSLAFHTNDRFFAETATPLPEGLCGAPALDKEGEMCGVVEGIIPVDHNNKMVAGSAAFVPSFVVKAFQDYAERWMLEQLLPKDMFQSIVRSKETNTIGGGSAKLEGGPEMEGKWEDLFDKQVEELKKTHSKEEVDAILWNVKREKKEVLEIMSAEGGDMDEVIERVRNKTLAARDAVLGAYNKEDVFSQGIQIEEKGNVKNSKT